MLASSFPLWISMWGGQGLCAGAHVHVLTAWLLMSFRDCFSLLGSFHWVYPFPAHPSWHGLLASSDFQCDSAWWFPPTGYRGSWGDTNCFYWMYNPTQRCFLCGQLIRLNPINMSRSSKVRKIFCCVLGFSIHFLIFISHQNKLVCAQKASKKITMFVPLWVHLLC